MLNPIKSIKSIIEGMWTVFKHLFKKPVTLEYPEKKRELNDVFRGKLEIHNCCGCGVCVRVCPSGAISFKKDETGKVVSYKFDLKKCIFCGNCRFYCPKGAIKMTKEYELASQDVKDLELVYNLENEGGNND